jgi:hypothetical protein
VAEPHKQTHTKQYFLLLFFGLMSFLFYLIFNMGLNDYSISEGLGSIFALSRRTEDINLFIYVMTPGYLFLLILGYFQAKTDRRDKIFKPMIISTGFFLPFLIGNLITIIFSYISV